MTGPEHYRSAETLLRDGLGAVDETTQIADLAALAALAQVHATLALAAATALDHHPDLTPMDAVWPGEAWRQVIS